MKEFLLMIAELLFVFAAIWLIRNYIYAELDPLICFVGYVFATAVMARNKAFA